MNQLEEAKNILTIKKNKKNKLQALLMQARMLKIKIQEQQEKKDADFILSDIDDQ